MPSNNCSASVYGYIGPWTPAFSAAPYYWSIKTAQMPREWSPFNAQVSAYSGDLVQVQYSTETLTLPGNWRTLTMQVNYFDGSAQYPAAFMPQGCNVAIYQITGDCLHKTLGFTLYAAAAYSGTDVWVPTGGVRQD